MRHLQLLITLLLLVLVQSVFGEQPTNTEPGLIIGSVYCDQDKNGVCDCEENGLQDIHIQIFREHCGGTALQTLHTDENGEFTIQVNDPGTYFVMVDLEYVCGGRIPTTTSCQRVELTAGETVKIPGFGYTVYGQ